MREKAQITHLAPSRESHKLRFKSERERKDYYNRHFKMFEAKLRGQCEKLELEKLKVLQIGKGPNPTQIDSLFDGKKDKLRQL